MYTITITETRLVNKVCGKEWKPEFTNGDKTEYGYTPEIEKQVEEKRDVLTQVVDEIDLPAVIRAINKL
jgi:hypothetical protein